MQLLIFLFGFLAASVARANILVIASSCKKGANEGISQTGHTLDRASSPVKCRILSRVLSHFHRATSISICGYCFLVGISYVQKHSSWKDNEIVYCHLLTRNLASFSVQQLPDGPTRRWLSFPRFSLVLLLNCPPNMGRTLNLLGQLHKMWILRNV